MKNIFLVWTKYQARVESLIPDLTKNFGEFEIIYRDNSTNNKFLKVFNYIKFFFGDLILLFKFKPKIVIVQTPPSFSLCAPLFYRFLKDKTKVVSDTHNAMTRKPWSNRLGSNLLMNKCDATLLHNNVVFQEAKNRNLYSSDKLYILEDKTIDLKDNTTKGLKKEVDRIDVFFPASFNMDEPINEVLECARNNPDIRFTLTGDYRKLAKNFGIDKSSVPSNFLITGWITNDEYLEKLNDCSVLLGLTIFDDIQMSVSNEGLGAEKVMVLSNKKALREIYLNAAVYTEHDSENLAKSIRSAYSQKNVLIEEIKKVKKIKSDRFTKQLKNFSEKMLINGGS